MNPIAAMLLSGIFTLEDIVMKEKEITVLMVEPGKHPVVTTLENSLDALQKAVSIGTDYQGLIELVELEGGVCLLCNEEGKLIGLEGNRHIGADIITGVSLFLLFVFLHISQGYVTVILAHITFCTPYVVLSVLPKLTQMNPNIYEAALDLGATPFQALRKVLLPMLKPGMISGFILAFTMSLDDFAVTFFTRGTMGLDTLSTYIYTDARKGGLTPELRPMITIMFVGILILLIIINLRKIRNSRNAVE